MFINKKMWNRQFGKIAFRDRNNSLALQTSIIP